MAESILEPLRDFDLHVVRYFLQVEKSSLQLFSATKLNLSKSSMVVPTLI